jgi:hypothetical protein
MTEVHQCPYCELRFGSRNELEDHISRDHPRELDDATDPRNAAHDDPVTDPVFARGVVEGG